MTEFADPASRPPPRRRRQEPRRAPATRNLLILILAAFVFEIVTGAWRNPEILVRWAIVHEFVFHEGEYWRLLTAMFLHGDGTILGALLHLALNSLSLLALGMFFEAMFGSRRFVIIYFATGLAAGLTSALLSGRASVGASGAIFGIVGAFITAVRRSPRYRAARRPRSLVNQLVIMTIANILIGAFIPKIDMYAHLGGLVAGLLIGAMLPQPPLPPPPPSGAVIDVTPQDTPPHPS